MRKTKEVLLRPPDKRVNTGTRKLKGSEETAGEIGTKDLLRDQLLYNL